MYRLPVKVLLSLILLGMAASLVWYSVCTNRISEKDVDFLKKHASVGLFPESWVLKGKLAYYEDLNAALAVQSFRRAIAIQPLRMDAWFELAKAEAVQGNEAEARKVVDTLSPLLAQISTWKWQEFLLANDMRDGERFAACFNFILNRLPYRTQEACYLAQQFWGEWAAVVPHLEQQNHPVFLRQLMRTNEADVALFLWSKMEEGAEAEDQDLRLRFCQFLLNNKRLGEAKKVWRRFAGDKGTVVYDGGFETEPMNMAFGWRQGRHPEVVVERTLEAPYSGSYSMHLHFRGTANVGFSHVSQVVPVEAGKTYHLSFAQKSRNLTTDQGIFLHLSGYGCKGLNVMSEPLLGSTPWTRVDLDVAVPEGCEAALIQIRRKESLKFDSKISGDYWIDAIEMK
ncbi:tetratricopeptide repeat protein [Desulforhabdus amnigena]|jgi:hypothetical protein|uniref:CBM-cenC domain-containing protein n=1 Tax=Desulforhabdus amnigena TaxID=40218 RepID=A0A9W6FWY3_9BACT|nr:hypothetical protein [Desulforhabdus amnigena]GLI36426.1 hypothetical protein DAMNIGENAA_38590 [Desulforhabdus amnigena]